jgi:hypothetical protein
MPKLGLGLSLPQTKAAGGFAPNKVSGLSLWLDASVGVSASGGDISLWADQSGGGIDAYPFDVAPVIVQNQINGKPAVRLTEIGGDDKYFYLNGNPMGLSGTTAFVVNCIDAAVFSSGGSGGDPSGALLGDFGSADDGSHWLYGLNNNVYDSFASTLRKDSLGEPAGIRNWNLYSVYSMDDAWELFCNGVAVEFDGGNVYSNAAKNDDLYIGVQKNNVEVDPQTFKGRIAEVVIYNRVLTTTERLKVQEYLRTKYALY